MKLSEIVNKTADVVYHCTNYEAAVNILNHDYFRSTKGKTLKGLSTTTDKNYFWGSSDVRFVLDLDKLKKDYKIEETDEQLKSGGNHLDESELVVVSDGAITSAHKYIIEIQHTPKKSLEHGALFRALEPYCEKYNIKYSVLQKD
jgi:hypothetical protein